MQEEELKDINKLVTIVIPTKNEENAIESVIDELHDLGFANILVVDGYSTDKTVDLAKKKGARVIHQFGSGKTGALKTAIDNVTTPYMVVIDGDYTYDPSNIYELLRYADTHAEVIGVRVPTSPESMSRLHKFGNKVLTFVFNLLLGVNISDLCSGLYVLRTDVARRLRFEGSGFDVEAEIAAQIAVMDKIAEVPVNYRPRLGKEKLSTWRHGFTILRSIIKFGIKYRIMARQERIVVKY
ncbi:MAG: hypothetical protein KatS3mg003_1237 [Candidatus Nitrosocaldaceae archaeon]|nr:MAG: hypothetical protein KatS3mg003_1237 [Candidatus Nitrosocaldaceae archaeon]